MKRYSNFIGFFWDPFLGGPDTLTLDVSEPNRASHRIERRYGPIEIDVPCNEIPSNQSLKASSEDEVYNTFRQLNKRGNWTMRIFVDAEGHVYFHPDEGNDWMLSIHVSYYVGKIIKD